VLADYRVGSVCSSLSMSELRPLDHASKTLVQIRERDAIIKYSVTWFRLRKGELEIVSSIGADDQGHKFDSSGIPGQLHGAAGP